MPTILRRLSVQAPSRWLPGLPWVSRGADEFGNPSVIIDVPMVVHLVVFHGRLDRDRWWSLGWTDHRGGPVCYYSPDGLLCVGIAPDVLGIDPDADYGEELDRYGLGTLPASTVLRLATWVEDTGAGLPEEAHRTFEPCRRVLGAPPI